MRKVRVAVLVSGGGTNLAALIRARDSGALKSGEIILAAADRADAFALTRAEKAGIETAVIPRKELGRERFEAELAKLLRDKAVDIAVLAGFTAILSENFVKSFKGKIINVHPSLIPSFCGKGFYGLKVHEAALSRGVKVTGATVHFVNEVPDGGEIILQRAVYVEDGDTPETLQRRVMEQAEWLILPEALEKVCGDTARKAAGAQDRQIRHNDK